MRYSPEGLPVLTASDVEPLIAQGLQERARRTAEELQPLITEAEQLRQRIERFYLDRVIALDQELDRVLKARFPDGVPDDEDGIVDGLSGNDKVFDAFHELLCVLHNAVPDYPNETRDDLLGGDS